MTEQPSSLNYFWGEGRARLTHRNVQKFLVARFQGSVHRCRCQRAVAFHIEGQAVDRNPAETPKKEAPNRRQTSGKNPKNVPKPVPKTGPENGPVFRPFSYDGNRKCARKTGLKTGPRFSEFLRGFEGPYVQPGTHTARRPVACEPASELALQVSLVATRPLPTTSLQWFFALAGGLRTQTRL